jgi:hypothetical protein
MNRILLIIFFLQSPLAVAKGAIAFSTNPDGSWFVFAEWNKPSLVLAEDAALNGCKAKGGVACKVVYTATNGCASVAVTNEGNFALGSAITQSKAQDKSINACLAKEPEGSCIVRKSFCDNTGGFIPDDTPLTPVNPGPNQFFCRKGGDYARCLTPSQRPATLDGPTERERYCRMVFC